MEYKRVIIAMVAVALIIAGSLATLNNREILGAQYKRCAVLLKQGDQLFLDKNYQEASRKYREALKIDPRNSKIWTKFVESEKKATLLAVQATLPKTAPQTSVPPQTPPVPQITSPAPAQPQGAIIEEDEGC